MNKLNITDLDKLKITKVKSWVVHFIYDGQKYFLHDDSDEDRCTGLYKKNGKNIELIYKYCFTKGWFGFRIWRIIKNSING